MKSTPKLLHALAAASLASTCWAAPTDRLVSRTMCDVRFDDADPSIAKEVWDSSNAGPALDEWLAANGHTDWVQKLDQDIFGTTSGSWACYDYDTVCHLSRTCEEYEEKGHGGYYHLFYSIQQARSFFSSFHEHLQDNTIKQTLDIDTVVQDFKRSDSPSSPNAMILLSGALGMLSGGLAFSAPASGGMGAASGLASVMANSRVPPGEGEDYAARLAEHVKLTFEELLKQTEAVTDALFGRNGANQDSIPTQMQKQTFSNAIVKAFGDGQWLLMDPSSKLRETMPRMYQRMKQALAMMMMRYSRKTIVLINTDVSPEQCEEQDPDAYYDEQRGECFNLFWEDDTFQVFNSVSNDMGDKLWSDDGGYNLDRAEFYANAYDCWINSGGKPGKPVTPENPADESLPQCFFSMVVVKGSFQKENSHKIVMTEFPGQVDGDEFSLYNLEQYNKDEE